MQYEQASLISSKTKHKPWNSMRICRHGSQSCPAEQHRITLRCMCITFTVTSVLGKGPENGDTGMERRVFVLDKVHAVTSVMLYSWYEMIMLLPELTWQSIRPWRQKTLWNETEYSNSSHSGKLLISIRRNGPLQRNSNESEELGSIHT